MTPEVRAAIIRGMEKELGQRKHQRFYTYFPDCTSRCVKGSMKPEDHAGFCRVLYDRHMAFVAAGVTHRERMFLKANRVGGTEVALFEVTAHLTGIYPDWWEGKRFEHPIRAWVAGQTMLTTRDILQVGLMGPTDNVDLGTWNGMIPSVRVLYVTRRAGAVPKCLEQVWVKHVSGGISVLGFRSYDQGATSFMGTEQELVLLDEEPPMEVYTECLVRTMTTKGLIMAIFTPLQGLTPFIVDYLKTAVTLDVTGQTVDAAGVLGIQA